MMKLKCVCFLIAVLALLTTAHAQWDLLPRPHDNWRTIQTDHFRIHYTPELEAWTLRAAEKMESIHSMVTSFIGYNEITHPMHVIIMDPLGLSNGMAIPFLSSPRIILWPNSPANPLMLGGLETWSEIVMVHEYAHAVHLTRKPRNNRGKVFSLLFPLGPLSIKLPLWVVEGYAVLIESRLTGYGRVSSSLRTMVLTQLAVEGKLPDYSSLNGGDQWMNPRYPYLVGSAFLEWLMDRSGDPECLDKLWKRLSAQKNRSFQDAFSGVFQNTPENLYARFRAEVTAEGLHLETFVTEHGGIQEGAVWQYLEGTTGEPAVSPDGTQMAVVLRARNKPVKLVIWSTEHEAEQKEDPALKDPDDVPALPMHPPKRKELHAFTARNGIVPTGPRFMPDGRSVLFHALRPRSNGDCRSDIYRWFPKSGRLDRLTRGAALAWADPCPDGTSVIALKQEYGYSGIVRLDLLTGDIHDVTGLSLDIAWHNPRLSPDGNTIATVRRSHNRTELVLIQMLSGDMTVVASTEREVLFHPAWTAGGDAVIFCSDQSGVINLEMVAVPSLQRTRLTRSLSGVMAPAPARNSENGCYFLKPHASGINIQYAILQDESADIRPDSGFDFTLPPLSVDIPEPFQSAGGISPEPYRSFDNLEVDWSAGVIQTPYSSVIQTGIRTNDILGRVHLLAAGSIASNGGAEGGMIALGYRRWPVHIQLKGFIEEEKYGNQRLLGDIDITLPETSVRGAELVLFRTYRGPNWFVSADAGVVWAQYETLPDNRFDHLSTGFCASARTFGNAGNWFYSLTGLISGQMGKTDDNSWTRYTWRSTLACGWKYTGLSISYAEGDTGGNAGVTDLFQMGGTTGSIQSDRLHNNRIHAPWHPAGALIGKHFSKRDLEIFLGRGMPLILYGSDISIGGNTSGESERVVGCEWRIHVPIQPVMRLAPMELSMGVAYGLEGNIESKWRGYVITKLLI
jgi:Tol biopolymer transport system component